MDKTQSLFSLRCDHNKILLQIEELADKLFEEDSAIEQLEALLSIQEENNNAIQEKLNNYCWVKAKIMAKCKARLEQADRLRALAQVDQNRANCLETLVFNTVKTLYPNNTKLSLDDFELKSIRTTRVEIINESLLKEFVVTTETTRVDKEEIKRRLKSGKNVPGASLLEDRKWRIT